MYWDFYFKDKAHQNGDFLFYFCLDLFIALADGASLFALLWLHKKGFESPTNKSKTKRNDNNRVLSASEDSNSMLRLDESYASDSEYTSDPDTGLKKQLDSSQDDKE